MNGKVRIAGIYGAGAAIGFTPQQVDQMSLWQYFAALNGYIAANSKAESSKLSDEEADELFTWIDSAPQQAILSTQTYRWDGPRPVPIGIVHFAAPTS